MAEILEGEIIEESQILDLEVIKKDDFLANRLILEKAMPLLEEKYAEVHDANTKEGYAKNKASAKELQKIRTAVDAAHKKSKAPYLEKGRQVDSLKNLCLKTIPMLEAKFKEANRMVDDRKAEEIATAARIENERVQTILSRMAATQQLPPKCMSMTFEEVGKQVDILKADDCEWADEHRMDAVQHTKTAIETLTGVYHFKKEKAEGEALMLAKKAIEEAERAEAERQEKIKQDKIAKDNKEKQDKLDAERVAFEAEKAASAKKLQDEQDKIDAQKKAEADRKAKEEADKLEAERLIQVKESREAHAKEVKAREKAILEKDEKRRVDVENNLMNILIVERGFDKKKVGQLVRDIVDGEFSLLSIVY